MKKKIFAIFLSLMMVTSLMTACGNSGKNNEKETSPEGSQTETADTGSEGKGKTITITSYDANPYALDEFAEMVAKFEADHPGVKVEIQHVTNDSKTMLKSKINSGDIPDVFAIQAGSEAQMFEEYAYDWSNDTEVLELFNEDALDRGRNAEGAVMALPWFYENMGMLYNKECFEKAGITKLPVNVQELEEACKKLKDAGITPFGLAAKETWVLSQLASHFILDKSLDGEGTNEALLNGTLKFADLPHFENVFKVLDLAIEYGPDKPMEIDWETSENMLANGEVAMIQMGGWCEPTLDAANPDAQIGFLPIPVGDTEEDTTVLSSSNWVFMVNKDSKNLDLAKEYLVYILTSEAGIDWICNYMCLVPCAKTDKEVNAMLANDAKTYIEAGKTNGWIHTIAPAEYQDMGGSYLQAYMIGTMTKEDVIQSLQDMWDAE